MEETEQNDEAQFACEAVQQLGFVLSMMQIPGGFIPMISAMSGSV